MTLLQGTTTLETATTDATGHYQFTQMLENNNGDLLVVILAPGNYIVAVTPPPGFGYSANTTTMVTLDDSPPIAAATANFRLYQATTPPTPPTIGGFIWKDANNNGTFDAGEQPLAGVTVTLLQGTTVLATATTDSTGNYLFTNLESPVMQTTDGWIYQDFNLPPGGYTVELTPPSGLNNNAAPTATVTLGDGSATGSRPELAGRNPQKSMLAAAVGICSTKSGLCFEDTSYGDILAGEKESVCRTLWSQKLVPRFFKPSVELLEDRNVLSSGVPLGPHPAFGTGGIYLLGNTASSPNFSAMNSSTILAIQGDGKILEVGEFRSGSTNSPIRGRRHRSARTRMVLWTPALGAGLGRSIPPLERGTFSRTPWLSNRTAKLSWRGLFFINRPTR